MTTWTEQPKSGVTETGDYLVVNASNDNLIVNASGDLLTVSNSKELSGITWTEQSKS